MMVTWWGQVYDIYSPGNDIFFFLVQGNKPKIYFIFQSIWFISLVISGVMEEKLGTENLE
jgi:hypothetical protein